MKAARWLGQRDRMNIDLQIDGAHYTVELQVVAVHVEPEKVGRLHESMNARGTPTINDLTLSEICSMINIAHGLDGDG